MTTNRRTPLKLTVYKIFIALFIIGTIPTTFITQPTYAAEDTAECDEAFYSSNDILFYNPCATSCSAGAGGGSTVSALRGNNNGEKIFNYWVDAGMTSQQSAGITGSMYHEGRFSPFTQETSFGFGNGGWGIAQFTGQPAPNYPDTGGQRKAVIDYLKADATVGADLFAQYYKAEYSGLQSESTGFVPPNVPIDVNDKFLLSELNYLLEHIKELKPNNIRRGDYQRDFNQTVDPSMTLHDYLKTIVQSGDAATAWTYLYEYPGDIKDTATVRANTAAEFMELYSNGVSSTCGGSLAEGGMTLEEAIAFMESYKTGSDSVDYIGGAGRGCPGGPLSNCVSFSAYFINKYTNIQGFMTGAPGNGSTVVANIIARNPDIQNGHSPRPYAIFSTPSGNMMCGAVKCGHTGVILGVDTARGKVIVGEAGCGSPLSWDTAREYELSRFDSDAYTYAYTEGLLKGDIK